MDTGEKRHRKPGKRWYLKAVRHRHVRILQGTPGTRPQASIAESPPGEGPATAEPSSQPRRPKYESTASRQTKPCAKAGYTRIETRHLSGAADRGGRMLDGGREQVIVRHISTKLIRGCLLFLVSDGGDALPDLPVEGGEVLPLRLSIG